MKYLLARRKKPMEMAMEYRKLANAKEKKALVYPNANPDAGIVSRPIRRRGIRMRMILGERSKGRAYKRVTTERMRYESIERVSEREVEP